MVTCALEVGGDTDTIAAMAGGIFGARHGLGAMPSEALDRLEDRARIEKLARDLCQVAGQA